MGLTHGLLQFLYPPRCPHCGQAVWHEGEWCKACFEKEYVFRHIEPEGLSQLQEAYVLSAYDNGVKDIIRHIKFNKKKERSLWLAPFLMSFTFALTSYCKEQRTDIEHNSILKLIDYIVPIPVSPKKQAERGYNQVDVIYKDWVQTVWEPTYNVIWLDCLEKKDSTKKMYSLGRVERKANVEHAFSLKEVYIKQERLKNKNILIVDDIYTTGATLEAAAQVLKKEGQAKTIYGLAVSGGHT